MPIWPSRAKALSGTRLRRWLAHRRAQHQRIVFTNGCFDLLHGGHVQYLERARTLGDCLLIGVNSDRSVRRLKGPGRPLQAAHDRARILAALACVDAVTIFDAPTPAPLIRLVRPHVLVKGGDWPLRQIVGAAFVRSYGGRVVRAPLLRGRSTSRLIARLRAHA